MSFERMNFIAPITKAIDACGYTEPTPVQTRCIPIIMDGKDVIASAQTGTGKTAAFVLPALQRLSTNKSGTKKPRILVLTPTRELANQITKATDIYGKFLQFKIISIVGGTSYRQQLKDLSRVTDMIVATPGRLLDHMENRRVDLSNIEMLILDEADRMLDMGFIDDVRSIAKATPNTRQTLLFSATVDEKLLRVVQNLLKNPLRIDLSNEKVAPIKIKQELYLVDHAQHKTRLLQHLLDGKNIYKAIIFTATKIHADKLARELHKQGHTAAALHGDLKQAIRNRTIEQMRQGKIQFLVATDVASRGINITDITHVINFDLPKFPEDYLHRVGRTGRAGKSGIAISLALPTDGKHLKRIEQYMGQRIPQMIIPGLEPTKKLGTAAPSHDHKNKKYTDRKRSFPKKERDRKWSGERKFGGNRKSGDDKKFSGDKKFGGDKKFSKDRKFGGDRKFSEDRKLSGDKKFGGDKKFSKDRKFSEDRKFSGDKKFGGDRKFSKDRKFGGDTNKKKFFNRGKKNKTI